MTTARQIIEQALRSIQVLGQGQTLSANEAAYALEMLNDLLGSWSVEGGLVFQDVIETFSLTGAASYTIGTGGDFNTARPYDITNAYVTAVGGSNDYPLQRYSQSQYANLSNKSITSGISEAYYFDNNFPLANIFLYPKPTSSYTITLYSRKPLTEFTTLNTDISLPSGYKRALQQNLAIDLAPTYEREPTQSLLSMARESKDNVLASNTRNEKNTAALDEALVGGFGTEFWDING